MSNEQISKFRPDQLKIAGLLAYYCFTKHTSKTPELWHSEINTARFACSLVGISDEVIIQISNGDIQGLPNPGRLSGGNFKYDYAFNPY